MKTRININLRMAKTPGQMVAIYVLAYWKIPGLSYPSREYPQR